MKFRITRQDDNTFELLGINDDVLYGFIVSKGELRQLSSSIEQTLETIDVKTQDNS
jgi:hypothetical protein